MSSNPPGPPGPRAPAFNDAVKVGEFHRPLVVDAGDVPQEELAVAAAKSTCGECHHFDLLEGQQQMHATRFLEQLVKDYGWQVRHLAAPTNHLGFCGAANSGAKGEARMYTARFNPSCDQFKREHLTTLRRKSVKEER